MKNFNQTIGVTQQIERDDLPPLVYAMVRLSEDQDKKLLKLPRILVADSDGKTPKMMAVCNSNLDAANVQKKVRTFAVHTMALMRSGHCVLSLHGDATFPDNGQSNCLILIHIGLGQDRAVYIARLKCHTGEDDFFLNVENPEDVMPEIKNILEYSLPLACGVTAEGTWTKPGTYAQFQNKEN